MKNKILIPLLLALLTFAILANFLPRKTTGVKESYYQGIQDYCEHVTILDVSTGKEINRTKEYCENLVRDFQNKKFYEKYHPSY